MVQKSSRIADLDMSTSQKSNPESDASPPTGSEDKEAKAAAVDVSEPAPVDEKDEAPKDDKAAKSGKPVRIELEVSRQASVGWTAFSMLFGALLLWKLGTVGVWAGIALVVLGVFRGFELFQTYRHPPGTFEVTEKRVVIPRGL